MIEVPKTVYEGMLAHAKRCYPQEACGFVAGAHSRAELFLPIENVERSTTSYLMDPRQQMQAFKKLREEKLDLLGIFHSHVASPAVPSPKDTTMAFYPEVRYLILSLADMNRPELRCFHIEEGHESSEELVVAPPEDAPPPLS